MLASRRKHRPIKTRCSIRVSLDEDNRLIGEHNAQGKTLQETVYLGDLPVITLKQTATSPVQTSIYYVHSDHINTPRVITQATDNQMVWRWDTAEPFGYTTPDQNPAAQGVFAYNPRFPGQVFDSETNQHYNVNRNYDAQIGRYTQSDPIGLTGGVNTFGYVEGNPVGWVDPDGLKGASSLIRQLTGLSGRPDSIEQMSRRYERDDQKKDGYDRWSGPQIPIVPIPKPYCYWSCPNDGNICRPPDNGHQSSASTACQKICTNATVVK